MYFISIIIHQLHLRSSGFRSQRLGTPALHDLSSPLLNLLGLFSVVQHTLQGAALYLGPSGSLSFLSAEQIYLSASILCPSATPVDDGLTAHLEMAPQADYPMEEMRSGLLIPTYKIKKHAKHAAAATAKSLHSCPTLCDPIDGSLLGSPVPGILQARTLEWVAISFSNA